MDIAEIERGLLQAHAQNDHDTLIQLYTKAADQNEAQGEIEACCFFLTHAFVFALEHGKPEMNDLNARLVKYGRAEPIPSK